MRTTSSVAPPQPTPAAAPVADHLPGVDPGPGRLRLSFSRVDSYLTCPLKFRFGYVDRLPSVPSPHLSWGHSVHAALERWWDRKLPEPPPLEDLLRGLYEAWDDSGFEGMPREEKVRWYRHAQDVLRRHHARHAAAYAPAVACEQWFELEVGDGVEVVGSIDHVARTGSGGIGIVDWKTNRKAKTRRDVSRSLQLAIYALAARHLWGTDADWVALDFVVPGVRVTVPREEIDTEAALRTIREVAEQIRAEVFPAKPSALCGWCDYRGACPAFAGEGPDLPGLAVTELKRIRRRQRRDAARAEELEALIRDRLGDEVVVEVGASG